MMLVLFSVVSSLWIPAIIVLCLWSTAVFAASTILQARIVSLAHEGASFVSTLNIGAFNLGNAIGAWIGGFVIDAGLPLKDISWAAPEVRRLNAAESSLL